MNRAFILFNLAIVSMFTVFFIQLRRQTPSFPIRVYQTVMEFKACLDEIDVDSDKSFLGRVKARLYGSNSKVQTFICDDGWVDVKGSPSHFIIVDDGLS